MGGALEAAPTRPPACAGQLPALSAGRPPPTPVQEGDYWYMHTVGYRADNKQILKPKGS